MKNGLLLSALLMMMCYACVQNDNYGEYKKMVKQELASGKKDSAIFLGVSLGMPGKTFYDYCWQMNKKGIFTDGENNNSVLYRLHRNELRYPALLNFYPNFHNNKISGMRATIQYEGWAPWNKNKWSDSLLPDVLRLVEKWHPGNAFLVIHDEEKGTVYVKVDGIRRITVGRFDDAIVSVNYSDLAVEQQLK